MPRLDLAAGLTLEFSAPDLETFPLLALARSAGEARRDVPVRVQRRQRGRGRRVPRRDGCPFLGIAEVVEDALEAADGAPARDLAELVEADADARRLAGEGVLVA